MVRISVFDAMVESVCRTVLGFRGGNAVDQDAAGGGGAVPDVIFLDVFLDFRGYEFLECFWMVCSVRSFCVLLESVVNFCH